MRVFAILLLAFVALSCVLPEVEAHRHRRHHRQRKAQKGIKLIQRPDADYKDFHCGGDRRRHSLTNFIEQSSPQAVESVACVKKAKKRIDCNIFFEDIVEPFRAEYLCRRNKHFEDIGTIVYPSLDN